MSKKNKNRQQNTTPISSEVIEENQDVVEESQEASTEVEESPLIASDESEPVESMEQPVEEPVQESNEPAPVVEEKNEEPKPMIESKPKGVLIVEKKTNETPTVKQVPETVQKFKDLADKYIAAATKASVSEDARKTSVVVFCSIAQYVTTASDPRVFDACFQFMVKNRALMLNPTAVAEGFYKYCDKTKITKVMQFYVTFQSLVQSKLLNEKFTLNPTTIRRTLNNNALANWLIVKAK